MELFGLNPIQIRGHLIQSCNASFEEKSNGASILHMPDLKLHIHDMADLFLADEIFACFSYPISVDEPSVVVDVGMNVGMAALDFARYPQVKRVYGFEPFPETFRMAQNNFSLNPELQKKIVSHCFGLSIVNESRAVDYSHTLRSGMTVRGIPPSCYKPGEVIREIIELKDICEVFIPIIQQSLGHRLILKMDCEGDEFELIPRLDSAYLLDSFDMMMIEFHHHEPSGLLEVLDRLGYQYSSAIKSEQILFQGKNQNMIYAARDPHFLK